jgi:diguanylate cyclase (GGDEF)-like protein
LNNFNYEGLQKCMEFSNLLSLLLEKYQLKLTASIDKLTGALTRKYLEDSLFDTLDRANIDGKPFSIIMYDLDRFKRVNDRFGHQTGDEVLKKISQIVMDNIDKQATLGRYGGEEFIIILPGVESQEALSIADELRKKIEARNILGDKLDITVSMGVVSYPEHGQTIDELIEKVDKAMYVAKEKGRNMCQLWSNEFINMAKPTSTIGGILTGNEVQDSRNVLALVELIELVNKNLDRKEKIYNFLGRTIEIIEAEFGILILLEKNKIKETFGRKTQQEGWIDSLNFNPTIVESVVHNRLGTYTIDWDRVEKHDLITGLPDWHSVLAVPVISYDEIKGVIYLSVSTRVKEFGADDLNFVNVLSNLLATII